MKRILRVDRVLCEGAEYKYELIEEEENERLAGSPSHYSIKITMHFLGELTEAETDFIFNSLQDVTAFYELLKNNLATPKNLEYVVIDEKTLC